MRISLSIPLSLREIADTIGARVYPCDIKEEKDPLISHITTDSREIQKGDLFLAIRGDKSDGNDYLSDVARRGAAAAICQKQSHDEAGAYSLVCENSVEAIGKLAAYYANKIPHKTVAITGSVGKTTTKECLRCVLAQKFRVHATQGNLNNELGLPYTILSMPKDTEILILEMGMSGLGEIAYLSKIARPDIAIITTIGSSHLEHLGSRENICRAKMEICEGMTKAGQLLLFGDEPLLRAQKDNPLHPKMISLSDTSADFFASSICIDEKSSVFDAHYHQKCLDKLQINLSGKHAVSAALFAVAVAHLLAINDNAIRRGLLSYKSDALRQNIYPLCLKDIKVTVIKDCYNAAPESMCAALEVLSIHAKTRGGRAVAVLGDMKELGETSRSLHEKIGQVVHQTGIDLLLTYGQNASAIADGARQSGMDLHRIIECPEANPQATALILRTYVQNSDTILFKASRAMKLEEVADILSTESF